MQETCLAFHLARDNAGSSSDAKNGDDGDDYQQLNQRKCP